MQNNTVQLIKLILLTLILLITNIISVYAQSPGNYLGCRMKSNGVQVADERSHGIRASNAATGPTILPTSSGTNCELAFYNYWIGPADENGLRSFEITISGTSKDGTETSHFFNVPAGTFTGSTANKYKQWEMDFDLNTCAFKSVSLVTIYVKAVSWNGTIGTGSFEFKVINNALMLSNPKFDSSRYNFPSIYAISKKMGQYTIAGHSGWKKNAILLSLPMYTVFYLDADGLWYDPSDSNSPSDQEIRHTDKVNISEPADAPPYKDANYSVYTDAQLMFPTDIALWNAKKAADDTPPYNFVDMCLVCDSLGNGEQIGVNPLYETDSLPEAFLSTTNVKAVVDQAYIGWDTQPEDGSCGPFDQKIWEYLDNGETITQAVKDAMSQKSGIPPPEIVSHSSGLQPGLIKIKGDPDMKLYGIYKQSVPKTQWWYEAYEGSFPNPHP